MTSFKWMAWVLVLFALSCGDSYDLGDEQPDSFSVNTTAPTWANGIGAVVTAKCANCHTSSRTDFVPTNTTTSLDNIANESFFSDASNAVRIETIRDRLLDGATRPMPPDFATPLTADELTALRLYIDQRIAALQN